MFGLGMPEIIVILILAVLIIGPKKLPEIGASVGKTLKDLRDTTKSVTQGISAPIREITSELREDIINPIKEDFDIKSEIQSFREDIIDPLKEDMGDLKDIRNPITSIQESFKDINQDLKNSLADSGLPLGKLPNIPAKK